MNNDRTNARSNIEFANAALFDKVVHGHDGVTTLPEGGVLNLVTKDAATDTGRALACLYFDVRLPDGSSARAQHVTTVRMLTTLLAGLRGRYGDEGYAT